MRNWGHFMKSWFITAYCSAGCATLASRSEDHPCIKLLDDDGELVKVYLPDLRVRSQDSQALLELKAKPRGFQELDYRQAQAYLSVSPEDVLVVLLNFGSESLGQDRIYQRQTVWMSRGHMGDRSEKVEYL